MAIINYYTTLDFVTDFFSPQLNHERLETTAMYDSRPANVCVGDYQQKVWTAEYYLLPALEYRSNVSVQIWIFLIHIIAI